MHFDSQTALSGFMGGKKDYFLVLKQKIYVIYTFKIYSGYKCSHSNLYKFKEFLFWQDELITNFDLINAVHAHRDRTQTRSHTLYRYHSHYDFTHCKMWLLSVTTLPESTERMRQTL